MVSQCSIARGSLFFALQKYNQETGQYEAYGSGYTTNKDGKILITDLPEGDYKLIETSPPKGYEILPEEQEYLFTISEDSGVTEPIQKNIYNREKSINVEFEKVSLGTGELLEGAMFILYKDYSLNTELDWLNNTQIIGFATSDEDGKIHLGNLTAGGFEIALNGDDVVIIWGGLPVTGWIAMGTDGGIIKIENYQILGSIQIHKVDALDGSDLGSVSFTLYDEYYNPVATETTESDGATTVPELESTTRRKSDTDNSEPNTTEAD